MEDKNPTLLPDFSDLHIVVIGDIMTDRYISGTVKRISPEAPVPIVEMEGIENRPGGAANVAMIFWHWGHMLLYFLSQEMIGRVICSMNYVPIKEG